MVRTFLVCIAITASSVQAQTGAVRVRLFADSSPASVTVQSLDAPLAVEAAGRPVSAAARVDITLSPRGGDVEASGAGVSLRGGTVRLTGGPLLVRSGRTSRTYLGDVAVSSVNGRLEIVNTVPLEDYVASVVASEYPFEEIEGVKAQAVLARTYALRRGAATPRYDLDDHQGSQVYRGEGAVTARSRQAAQETAGQVLLYAGALAETPYFSSSGGHTADNEAVWRGTPLPYLRGVPDPTDAGAPDYRWTTSASRQAVHDALSRRLGGRVSRVEVAERSPNGRVVSLRAEGAGRPTLSGSDFRTAVNAAVGDRTIRSTQFEVRLDGDRYVFEGRGYGHGVGMSQYGARGLAREGRSYREILDHYFQGTRLGTTPGATTEPLVASAPEAGPTPRWPSDTRIVDRDDAAVPARARTWPVPRRVAREAAPAPRRTGW